MTFQWRVLTATLHRPYIQYFSTQLLSASFSVFQQKARTPGQYRVISCIDSNIQTISQRVISFQKTSQVYCKASPYVGSNIIRHPTEHHYQQYFPTLHSLVHETRPCCNIMNIWLQHERLWRNNVRDTFKKSHPREKLDVLDVKAISCQSEHACCMRHGSKINK